MEAQGNADLSPPSKPKVSDAALSTASSSAVFLPQIKTTPMNLFSKLACLFLIYTSSQSMYRGSQYYNAHSLPVEDNIQCSR